LKGESRAESKAELTTELRRAKVFDLAATPGLR
jgi:hypothetical protein